MGRTYGRNKRKDIKSLSPGEKVFCFQIPYKFIPKGVYKPLYQSIFICELFLIIAALPNPYSKVLTSPMPFLIISGRSFIKDIILEGCPGIGIPPSITKSTLD